MYNIYKVRENKMAEATNPPSEIEIIDEAIINQMEQIQREISDTQELVGELEDIDILLSEYENDPVYHAKAKDLSESYAKLRRTRGDGNCFFRAFAFACVEKLSKKELDVAKFKGKLEEAKQNVIDLGYSSFTVEDFHDNFMEVIDSLERDHPSIEDLLKIFQDQGQSDYLVCYMRIVASGYLQKNSEFYLPFLQGHANMKEFCSKEVEPMRCESDHVHISALTQALEVSVRVQYMDRGEGGKVNHHDFPEDSKPIFHLLYRPGHYDILYLSIGNKVREIRAVLPTEVTADVELVSCVCADIGDPKQTSFIVKNLPLFPLHHVKRVRNHEGQLQILLTPTGNKTNVDELLQRYKNILTNFKSVLVPKLKPITRKQYEDSCKHWPVNFHENKLLEKKLTGENFNQVQLGNIKSFMCEAIKEARLALGKGENPVGVVISDPASNTLIARAHPSQLTHPLKHAVMVCIDHVAVSQGGGAWENTTPLESESEPESKKAKKPKQYLCTGYDAYITMEPCTMCSMALLHSRIQRVFYGTPDPSAGGLGSRFLIHCQKGLNHHFEVYSHVEFESCLNLTSRGKVVTKLPVKHD